MVFKSGSEGYTIVNETADLTFVQETITDILHKEDKTQKVIAKDAGCSQTSASMSINW